jgi:predicted transcriptional regulator
VPENLQWPGKEVDVDFMVFVERHATDLLRLDILTFWGKHPNYRGTVEDIAQKIGRSTQTIRPELGDLALTGILEKLHPPHQHASYGLCQKENIRRMVQKLAESQ